MYPSTYIYIYKNREKLFVYASKHRAYFGTKIKLASFGAVCRQNVDRQNVDRQNVEQTKCRTDKMPNRQNAKQTKCRTDQMSTFFQRIPHLVNISKNKLYIK